MEENKEQLSTEQETIVDENVGTANSDVGVETETVVEDAQAQKIEDLEKALLRVKADYDNFRRRTVDEKIQLSTFITADVVGKLLPIVDTFQRARNTIVKSADEQTLAGFDMIIKQFEQTFENIGVEKIATDVGASFDPMLHEAVMSGTNPDLSDNAIEMTFEEGYKYKDKVIRHSKVKVVNS